MIGTILNVAGILVGSVTGLMWSTRLSPTREAFFKVTLGALTVFYGLRLTWLSLNGPWQVMLKQLLITILALIVGKLVGKLLHLQKMSNRLGQQARERIAAARPGTPNLAGMGFKTCSVLFCATPLGIVGAIEDGLSHSAYFYPLAIKGVIDGLATIGFTAIFGAGVMLSALPVLAWQGTVTLVGAQYLEPFLRANGLSDSVHAVAGLLVFSVALVILNLKKIELADYLPSLAVAPVMTWLWG